MTNDNENLATEEEIIEELKEEDELIEAGEAISEEAPVEEMTAEEEIQDLEDRNLRLLADMQNLRNRHQKDMKDAREYAISSFAQDMILVLENINRAKDSIPEEENDTYKSILDGINMVREEVIRTFENHGIKRVEPKPGEKFDYKIHQALVQIPTNEFNEGEIVNVIHAGYIIKERVLRAAMVGVAKAAPEHSEKENEEE